MKMNHAISPIENPMKIRVTRRGVAMLHTELTKRIKEAASKQQ
jgi:large subunit ribosomal protein L29